MEFLNPAALYALFLLPILIIPYFIRRKPRQFVFSSLLLLRDLSSRTSGRPWGVLRLPPIFFLQLLLLLLLILALGEPVFPVRLLKVAVVLDNSASMQALEGRKTRFQIAQAEVRGMLQDLSARARVDIFLTAPRLERIGDADLAPSRALAMTDSLSPYDLGEPPVDYGEAISNLAKEKNYGRIFLLTDHSVDGQSERIKVITVGRPRENLAITSFQIIRGSFVAPELKAMVEVRSFSAKEEKVKLSLKGGGRILSTQALTVGPGTSIQAPFERFPLYPFYEAEIEQNDALALDNHRFAVPPVSRELKILGISPRPEALYNLRSIPGVSLNVVSPGAYEKERGQEHDLEIFHYSAPVILPQNHALFILPPAENPLVALEKPLSQPQVTGWREPHTLTRYINFALFRPAYARPLRAFSFGDAVIQCPEGALAIAVERREFRYLVLGFDPFPYLGRENLPISIFTLNVLQWFNEGIGTASSATGKPLNLEIQPEGAVLLTPKGEKFPLKSTPTPFPQTYFQGIYEVVTGGEREFRAVNLDDSKESDLIHTATINLGEKSGGSSVGSSLFSLWPYLLVLSLFLLLLEWYFNPSTPQLMHAGHNRQKAGFAKANGKP